MTSPDLKPKQLAVAQTALNETAEEIVELVVDVEDRHNVVGLDALEMAWADIIVSMADMRPKSAPSLKRRRATYWSMR